MVTREYIGKLLSEILSDQFEAKITVIMKEPEENVPNMSTDTMSDTMSQRSTQDCA